MLNELIKAVARRRGYTIVPDNQVTILWGGQGVDAVKALLAGLRPIDCGLELKRFGGDSDGAYLLPDDLEGIEAVFSPGVADVATFEEQMAELGMECFLADASVEEPPVSGPKIHFSKKFIGISDSGTYIRLDTWVNQNAPGNSDLILQMDIEGAEWPALMSASDQLLKRFRIIVIELHDTVRLLDCSMRREVLERLLLTHNVVHTHVNNACATFEKVGLEFPCCLELTFLRKDRGVPNGASKTVPHPLDVANLPDRPPVAVPECWLT